MRQRRPDSAAFLDEETRVLILIVAEQEPVLEARLRPARGAGADQLAPRRQLRLRAPLRARPGEDEDAPGPGGGRHDGAGAGRGPGGPPGADAFAGRPGAALLEWHKPALRK